MAAHQEGEAGEEGSHRNDICTDGEGEESVEAAEA